MVQFEPLHFSNQDIQLSGTLYKPDTVPPYPCVIVLHAASGGTRAYPFYQHLSTHLPEQGIAVLLYDRRGSGESTGVFETADFNDLASDALAGFDLLRARHDIDPHHIYAYGISQGGWIAPIVAARQPEIAGVVIVSGSGVSPARQMDYAAAYTLDEAGFAENVIAQAIALRQRVNDYYRGKFTRAQLQSEIALVENEPWFKVAYMDASQEIESDVTQSKWYYEMDFAPLAIWQRVHQPTLFLFGTRDRWVPVAESETNFRHATTHLPDVTFRTIDNADHLMTESPDENTDHLSEHYMETLLHWLVSKSH